MPQRNHRLNIMEEQLRRDGEVTVTRLSQQFEVSEMTIRRDLERLESLGIAKRTFGGAILMTVQDSPLQSRSQEMTREKMRVGRFAACSIKPGQTVFVDAGSTTFQMVRYLPFGMDITVVTNALNIAMELFSKQIPTTVVGGFLRQATASLVGPVAEHTLEELAFDKAFLGATGLSIDHGFSNSNVFEAGVKRLAVSRSSQAIVLMDHTKFGVRSLASFARIKDVHSLITSQALSDDLYGACMEAGLQVCIAEEEKQDECTRVESHGHP